MKTVRNLIDYLHKLIEDDPRVEDLPIIYSSDDEGNNYQKVHNLPELTQVEDLNAWNLEVVGYYDEDSDEIVKEDCNCVIIN